MVSRGKMGGHGMVFKRVAKDKTVTETKQLSAY